MRLGATLGAVPSAAASQSTRPSRAAPTGLTPRKPASTLSRDWQAAEDTTPDEPVESAPAADASPNANPEDTNVWPDAEAEAAFLAEARARGEPVTRAMRAEDEEEKAPKQVPKLDELVEQIPAETRELIEDLFRAKFVAVRRVKKADLKPEEQS